MPRREIAPGRSCLECRRRKIKCDRSHPCSYCTRVRVNCRYPSPRQPADDNALARVASLESKLLVVEKRLSQIVEPMDQGNERGERARTEFLTDRRATGPSQSPSVGLRSSSLLKPQAAIDLNSVRPTLTLMVLLWQKYLEVVDPLLKIFHTPTVQKLVVKAVCDRDKLDLGSQCLLFAIYYAAVIALSPTVCRIELGGERCVLLEQYRTGVEHLLSRLDLLHSTDMTVLQAFAIYLITGRCDPNGPDSYSLVGVGVGMALKMGLNQDGATLGVPPFEGEMRRRLWWQLLILDVRVAEDRQSEPCVLESSFNTRLPSNIGDTDLQPEMSRLPVCGESRTEMLFSLMRFETSYFARQMVFSDGFGAENAYLTLSETRKCEAIGLFQERIENQYLSHCDERVPLDKVTIWSIRLILAKLRLMVLDRKAMGDGTPVGRVTARAEWIKLLQSAEELRAYEDGKQWLWLFQTYIEWDALTQLLIHLRADPVGGENDQGWDTASNIYSYWEDNESVQRDRRWQRIEELRQDVLAARGENSTP
ncbi:hypothetical protein BDW62DRAFT_197325 [Aspergillus aurantiobrunneus]